MNKAVQQAAPAKTADSGAEQEGGLMKAVLDGVRNYLKATRNVEYTDNYQSTSTSISTVKETIEPEPPAPVVVVAQSADGGQQPAEKTAPAEPKPAAKAQPGSETTVVVITEALKAATEPIVKAVQAFDGRLAKLEGTSVGSRKLKSVVDGGAQVSDNGGPQFPAFAKELSERFGLTAGQKLSKAVITAGGWTTGIIEEEAERFIDYVVDESAFLPLVRRISMTGRVRNIDKLGLGSTVFKKGTPGTDPGDTVSLSGPTQIQLIAKEIIAIVSVGDDTLEDNIEGDAFVQHLLGMIARAGANEIEQAVIHGDVGVADSGILDRWDGVLVRAAADGYHALDATADATLFWAGANGVKGSKAIRAMPTKFRRDKSKLRFFVHPDAYINYEDDLAGNVSPDAFQAITGSRDLPLKGVQHVRVPLMRTDLGVGADETVAILADPMNFIFGVQREIRIEAERQARKRATDFVVTLRGDVQVETGDAVVVYEKLKIDPA